MKKDLGKMLIGILLLGAVMVGTSALLNAIGYVARRFSQLVQMVF